MSERTEIHAGHPLWRELRNGLLWHCTSISDCRKIRADGYITPNDGRIDRWGTKYACEELGAVSLFDLTTQTEEKVLEEAIKWQQFLGSVNPVTVLLGIERGRVLAQLIPYPNNKEGTTGPVIPWVEVCHLGKISCSAIVSHLLVCSVDYLRFKKLTDFNERELIQAETEFGEVAKLYA
jgi:hypothetical protein